jgi:hypothetical protein
MSEIGLSPGIDPVLHRISPFLSPFLIGKKIYLGS